MYSPPMNPRRVWQLEGKVQHYAWGKVGANSIVAQLYHRQNNTEIDDKKPYAELWLGTHPSGEAQVKIDNNWSESLTAHIARNPADILGSYNVSNWGNQLPFLLKVLSINKALSIQAHPDKELAAKLHKQFPDIYTDGNHKPEMAIAITPFEAMSGFRTYSEIVKNIKEFPELEALLGSAAKEFVQGENLPADQQKSRLQTLFRALMTADPAKAKEQLDALLRRIEKSDDYLSQKIRQIHADFPGDPGVFCLLLLNVISLKPGEALYMGPNDPHAYFKGDCIECMATSDNVVRAGLTPKFKDVETLVNMLTYKQGDPSLTSVKHIEGQDLYDPPAAEFEIRRVQLKAAEKRHLAPNFGPSIILILSGQGKICGPEEPELSFGIGSAFFVYANTAVTIEAQCESDIFIASLSSTYKQS